MIRLSSGILLVLVLSVAASKATDVKTLNTVKGAEIWFVEDHKIPVIALEAALPAGSSYDPSTKPGLANFAASMLDEGADKLDSKAFHEALADRAIQLSVVTDRDYLKISLLTETENAATAFHLLGLALQRARFDADAVGRVRAQILQNQAAETEEPETVATKGFFATYFSNHPYAHSPDGDTAGVNGVTQNDLRTFARTHWVRGGLKIAVAGDVGAATISSLLASAFGGLPGNTPPSPPLFTRTSAPPLRVIDMALPQPTAVFALAGLRRSDPDFIPAFVANNIVGGGFSARLSNEVRVKRGLTYDISTDLVGYRKAGLLFGSVGTRRENVRQSIAVIRVVLSKFAAEGATAQELNDAKTYLTGSFPLAFASNAGIASQLNTFQCEGLSPDYVTRRNNLIEAVTLDDIRRVAKRFFNPARLTVVIAGTPADSASPKSHR